MRFVVDLEETLGHLGRYRPEATVNYEWNELSAVDGVDPVALVLVKDIFEQEVEVVQSKTGVGGVRHEPLEQGRSVDPSSVVRLVRAVGHPVLREGVADRCAQEFTQPKADEFVSLLFRGRQAEKRVAEPAEVEVCR